jgi:pSer/pThr/pTyr-binding forkhead associated (FHA) protein
MSNSLPNEMTEDNTMGTSSLENSSSEVANVHNVAENNLPEIQELQEVAAYPEPIANPSPQSEPDNVTANKPANASTQLQQFAASLLHIQTNLNIEIPAHLPVVHIGKPNMVIPPDIDVSGFPDSDIVSRIHADIRAEGGSFYFEDTGSSNGTYINNLPLPAGNRHKLRAGDRISLGKGDKVSFVFQVIE